MFLNFSREIPYLILLSNEFEVDLLSSIPLPLQSSSTGCASVGIEAEHVMQV